MKGHSVRSSCDHVSMTDDLPFWFSSNGFALTYSSLILFSYCVRKLILLFFLLAVEWSLINVWLIDHNSLPESKDHVSPEGMSRQYLRGGECHPRGSSSSSPSSLSLQAFSSPVLITPNPSSHPSSSATCLVWDTCPAFIGVWDAGRCCPGLN